MYGDHSQDWLITSSLEPLRDGLEDCFLTWIDTTELQRPISLNGYQQPISSNGPWSPCPPIGSISCCLRQFPTPSARIPRPNTPVISWHFGRMAPILCLLAVDQFWLALSICMYPDVSLSVPLLCSTFHSQALDVAWDPQSRFYCRRVAPTTLCSKDRNNRCYRNIRNSCRKSNSSSNVYKARGICLTLQTKTHIEEIL